MRKSRGFSIECVFCGRWVYYGPEIPERNQIYFEKEGFVCEKCRRKLCQFRFAMLTVTGSAHLEE